MLAKYKLQNEPENSLLTLRILKKSSLKKKTRLFPQLFMPTIAFSAFMNLTLLGRVIRFSVSLNLAFENSTDKTLKKLIWRRYAILIMANRIVTLVKAFILHSLHISTGLKCVDFFSDAVPHIIFFKEPKCIL